MDRHLVAVKVRVVSGANKRMNPDRFAFDEQRLESLNGKTMQRRRAVQQHRMPTRHFFENIPNLRGLALDHFLSAAHRVDVAEIFQPANDERLEQNERHLLRQTALVQLQLGSDHNNGTARVIDALAEQVLAETSALPLEHVAKRFQRAIAGAGDSAAMTAVIEQRIDCFLEHALFVADNDVRRLELEQVLQPVVPVDDPAIQIVEIGSREPAAFERNERPQVRRNDRQNIEHHPIGTRVRGRKALDEFQTLRQLLANLFALGIPHRLFQLFVELVEVDLRQEFLNRFRAHPGDEIFAVLFLRFAILDFVQELRLGQRRLARIDDDVVLVIDHALELPRAHVEHQAESRRHALVKPDVRNRDGQFNVAHPFAANARQRDFHAATVADHALVLDPLVFSARAFPIPGRPENALAKQTALFGLEGPVVDRLRILDLTLAPRPHRVRGRDADRDLVEADRAFFTD